jgi:hypothetical protein
LSGKMKAMRFMAAVLVAAFVNLTIVPSALAAPKRGRSKAPPPTMLDVASTVPGATVLIDGEQVGQTPLRNRVVQPKQYTVTVRKLGYLEFTQKVTATANTTTKVVADLLPFAGVIHVTSSIPKAQVAVDGKIVGVTPLDYEVKIGTRNVTVTAQGHAPYTQVVRANPGEVYDVKAKFGKAEPEPIAAAPLPGDDLPLVAPGGEETDLPLEPMALSPGQELALEGLPGGLPPADTAPMATTATIDTSKKKPLYKQWWPYAVGGAVVAAVVIAVVISSGGGDEGPQPDTVIDY